MYKNHSGYANPTEGEVVAKMMREYREKQKGISRKQQEIRERPRVYVVSKYAGDVKENARAAIRYCRFVINKKCIPIASHLLYPRILNDNDPKERELGLLFGQVLLSLCREVWVFGREYSTGMQAEIHEAKRLKKNIRYFTEEMEELHEND